MRPDPYTLLKSLFDVAVARAHPTEVMRDALPPAPASGRIIVLGAGKAAAAMAAALETAWDRPLEGLVVTRYGHGCPTRSIKVIEAGHPMPDAAGADAAAQMLDMANGAGAGDTVVFLASGGASALLAAPAQGIELAEKQALTGQLLRSGATIHQMNAVRKHLSAIKGGRLAAAAAPARLLTLAISDVPGDDVDVIGSGPTVPDNSTLADAKTVLQTFGIEPAASIAARLSNEAAETPKPGNPVFDQAEFKMIATPFESLAAAKVACEKAGIPAMILSDRIEGEACEVAKVLGALARSVAERSAPVSAPVILLSGGETTVTVRGKGRGGRNAEFLLALAIELDGLADVYAIACDTDGIDGSEDNAGAIIGPDMLIRCAEANIDAKARLADNDGYSVFEGLGDLIVTGPTLTNINDFRAILVLPAQQKGNVP
ncbi:MAG: glycerate kinase type-2 family protein [Alphaproteobacteria bacterium]